MNVHLPLPHQLLCVAPNMLAATWPLVSGLIDEGYAAVGEITPPELFAWLRAGKGQLWISIEDGVIMAALTTSIVPMRHDTVLRMICCGGSRIDLWKSCHEQIEEFARAEGCARVVSEGRPGWSRALAGGGYKVVRVTIEKRL